MRTSRYLRTISEQARSLADSFGDVGWTDLEREVISTCESLLSEVAQQRWDRRDASS